MNLLGKIYGYNLQKSSVNISSCIVENVFTVSTTTLSFALIVLYKVNEALKYYILKVLGL